jgi:hypothetical protein
MTGWEDIMLKTEIDQWPIPLKRKKEEEEDWRCSFTPGLFYTRGRNP